MKSIKKVINLEDNIFKENNLYKIKLLGSVEKYRKAHTPDDKSLSEYVLDDYRERYLLFKMQNDIYVLSEKFEMTQETATYAPINTEISLVLSSVLLTKDYFYDIFSPGCNKIDNLEAETHVFYFIPEKDTYIYLNKKDNNFIDLGTMNITMDDDFISHYYTSIAMPFTMVNTKQQKIIENINIYPFIDDFLKAHNKNLEIF